MAGIKAGTDLDCGGCYRTGIKAAIESGLLTEAELDVSLARTLQARIEFGTLDPPGTHGARFSTAICTRRGVQLRLTPFAPLEVLPCA
jgi:hypothetical protein